MELIQPLLFNVVLVPGVDHALRDPGERGVDWDLWRDKLRQKDCHIRHNVGSQWATFV